MRPTLILIATSLLCVAAACAETTTTTPSSTAAAPIEEPTHVYWGDTHLHSNYSPDAYLQGNSSADPDTAYRFAKGLPAIHPGSGAKVRLSRPLDFLALTDHGEFMGIIPKLIAGDPLIANTKTGKRWAKMFAKGKGVKVFAEGIEIMNSGQIPDDLSSPEINAAVWADIVEVGQAHDDPGTFTTFIGWEWTSTPEGYNLHRVVISPDAEAAKKYIPFNSFDSTKPEDLWAWLEKTNQETGARFVAIPHNSNISNGLMFDQVDSEGRPITAEYARMRMKWEPVVEMTQMKGDSETHPTLSPTDEFADYETYEHLIKAGEDADPHVTWNGGDAEIEGAKAGDYARSALRRGLEIEAKVGANPYKFGMIGATDSHTGLATYEETNFWGKYGTDSTPEGKDNIVIPPKSTGWDIGAAGLAGVWAEENTRESLFSAFQRKEVYATTGPRIRLRFFGGWEFSSKDARNGNMAAAGYDRGVPMGGDLTEGPAGKAPAFLIHAVKDPLSGNLDRVQVIKGWVDSDGKSYEKIYNVAWSGERTLDANGALEPVGNTVDISKGVYTNDIGTSQLVASWADPDFDPEVRAFYYLRVLEIPTPRSSLYDTLALREDASRSGKPAFIQERAYSSPIWYTP